jgi:hypothetical protein
MAANHIVTVTYVNDAVTHKGTVGAVPFLTRVRENETVEFQRGDNIPGTMRITFREKGLFGTKNPEFSKNGRFFTGDGPVTVKPGLAKKTFYHCELLGPNGEVLIESTEPESGGAIEPDDQR